MWTAPKSSSAVALFLVALGAQSTAGLAGMQAPATSANFQICRADDQKKCDGISYLPCKGDAPGSAELACLKSGSQFFTLARIKSTPGGECGVTIFGVKCQ